MEAVYLTPVPDLRPAMRLCPFIDPVQYGIDRAEARRLIKNHHPDGNFQFVDGYVLPGLDSISTSECRITIRYPAWLTAWISYLEAKYPNDETLVLASVWRYMMEYAIRHAKGTPIS
jgi:hypothetical protein